MKTIISHLPRALPFLFLTELWERFGFYIVQGMLVLYMTQSFGFSDDLSYTISGVFAALVYISPIVGGYLADRLLGFKTAILWGSVFLIVGYVCIALPLAHLFYVSLAIIIIGNGLFKPNISSLLGMLYGPDDPNRDTGFTIFYVGINIGALLAGISSGYARNHLGWHASFALAGIGLFIGLVTFVVGMKYMKLENRFPLIAQGWLCKPLLFLYSLVAIGLVSLLLNCVVLAKWLLPMLGIFLLIFLSVFTIKQAPIDRNRLQILIVLTISSVVFWMLCLQIFFSLNLFVERLIHKNWFGLSIPTTAFYSLEGAFIILFGPLMAWFWQWLSTRAWNPSPVLKFMIAMICVSAAFLLLSMSTYFHNDNHLINPLWVVLSYSLISLGELFLSPIGLSAVTMLAPMRMIGMMMGVWFVATGFGGEFAGWLAKLANVPESAKQPLLELPIYRQAFLVYALIALGMAVVLLFVHFTLMRHIAFERFPQQDQ